MLKTWTYTITSTVIKDEVRVLAEWSGRAAAARLQKQSRKRTREMFLEHLVLVLGARRVSLSTAENSKLVRVARIACERIGIEGDPRDALRQSVASGVISLKGSADAPPQKGGNGGVAGKRRTPGGAVKNRGD